MKKCILLVVLVLGCGEQPTVKPTERAEQKSPPKKVEQQARPAKKTDAGQLPVLPVKFLDACQEIDENQVAFRLKSKGKRIETTAMLMRIDDGRPGTVACLGVRLGVRGSGVVDVGTKLFEGCYVYCHDLGDDALARLKPYQLVTVQGTYGGTVPVFSGSGSGLASLAFRLDNCSVVRVADSGGRPDGDLDDWLTKMQERGRKLGK